MSLATDERAALCDTLDAVGPGRRTLCAGWRAADLLGHLLVRERRPHLAAGIVLPPLSRLTQKAMRSYDSLPWADRVDLLRRGAPPWSPFSVAVLDRLANGAELFVHHEDVLRGEPDWRPRPADPVRDAALWGLLTRSARVLYRRSPVGVELSTPTGDRIVAKAADRTVLITGEAAELVLHAFGRHAVRVEIDGRSEDVSALEGSTRAV